MNSCFEIFHETSHFLFLVVSGSGINFIPFKIAAIFQTHSLMGFFSILVMFTSLSIDRLIAAAFPIFYKNIRKKQYIYCHASAILVVSFFILYRMIYVAIEYPEWPVTGNIADTLAMITYDNSIIAFLSSPFTYIPPLFCYLLLGLVLICRKDTSEQHMKKIYRSIFIIIFVNIGCYLFGLMIGTFFYHPLANSSISPINLFLLQTFIMVIVNIGGATNAPILFINSCDYRNAYKKEFNKIKHFIMFKCFGIQQQTNQITALPKIHQNQITSVVNPN
uniref:G_PROTEIN_RECEP_F1_2 domain-containing protein n=1 Tax=Meloidogyne hapla TaxID=6305 RepID=A0A1I8AXF7_MELHA